MHTGARPVAVVVLADEPGVVDRTAETDVVEPGAETEVLAWLEAVAGAEVGVDVATGWQAAPTVAATAAARLATRVIVRMLICTPSQGIPVKVCRRSRRVGALTRPHTRRRCD